MTESVKTTWLENMAFEWDVNEHKVIIDAKEAVGGQNLGPQPKTFMLAALGGCTAMDVVAILKKMRVTDDIEDFQVDVSGELTEEHPKHFTKMHVKYCFTPKDGKVLDLEKLQKAVSLSEERYCGVSVVYKKAMEVTSEIVIKNH